MTNNHGISCLEGQPIGASSHWKEWEALLSVRTELPLWLAELLSQQDQGPLEVRG